MLDTWEHASSLQHRSVNADHVSARWTVVNRADVTWRFTTARTATQGLIVA